MKSSRIWLWGFLGYFFSLVDDDPLNADTLLGLGYGFYLMELLLRSLTVACFYLALRDATGRRRITWRPLALMGVALAVSFADDFRYFLRLGFYIGGPWEYPVILGFQALSLVFFVLAVRRAASQAPRF